MLYILIILAVGICLYVSLAPRLPGMQEGVWEITMEAEMPGTPPPGTVTNTQRLNKETPVPEIALPGFECRLRRMRYPYHVVGNYLICRLLCQGRENLTAEGRGNFKGSGYIKYSGTTLKGKIKLRSVGDQSPGKFSIRITGSCKSAA